MKETIESLEPEDVIYVRYGWKFTKAIYLGNGYFRTRPHNLIASLYDPHNRLWTYRRKSFKSWFLGLLK